ncbi:MAG: hypothetical protein RL059_600, partial [Bacteroidota bacterium]
FQHLKTTTRILATWDDHDYGKNDSGKEFIRKKRPFHPLKIRIKSPLKTLFLG